jgi:hypothetical protein
MPGRLKIPREHQPAFVKLRELGPTVLDELNARIRGVFLHRLDLERVLRETRAKDAALLDEADVSLLAEVLVNLAMLAGTGRAEALLADLAASLHILPHWSATDVAAWETIRPSLARLLTNETLLGLGKAIRLQYEHTNILTETRLITDVRPVFDADATKPVAAMICHTLRIAYTADGASKQLAFALDTQDLRSLAKVCERALRKADVLSAYLKEPTALPSRIAGSSDDGT